MNLKHPVSVVACLIPFMAGCFVFEETDRARKLGACCRCLSETKPDGSPAPDGSAESVDENCLPPSPDDGPGETDVGGERAECGLPDEPTDELFPAVPIRVVDDACGATVCEAECQEAVALGFTFTTD
jgi:hypothetical protein